MTVSVPDLAPETPPETGASISVTPAAVTGPASSLVLAGSDDESR
jgi:hypothetical protein